YGGDWHDLLPGSEDRLVYHGFLRVIDLDVQSAAIESHSARITFGTKQIRPGRFPGYPWAVDVDVTYLIGPGTLEVEVAASNVGSLSAPYGCGWHPYFALGGGTIDGLVLTVPANRVIKT